MCYIIFFFKNNSNKQMNWDHTLAVCVSYTANFHHCGEVTKVDNKGTCHRKFSVRPCQLHNTRRYQDVIVMPHSIPMLSFPPKRCYHSCHRQHYYESIWLFLSSISTNNIWENRAYHCFLNDIITHCELIIFTLN